MIDNRLARPHRRCRPGDDRFHPDAGFQRGPPVLTEGDGIRVRDVDGRWYIDGLSGTFCMSLGHGNARVVEAASKQLSRLALAAPTMATSDRSLELARELLGAPAASVHDAQVGQWRLRGGGGGDQDGAPVPPAGGRSAQVQGALALPRLSRGDRPRAGREWLASEPEPIRAARGRVRSPPHAATPIARPSTSIRRRSVQRTCAWSRR